MFAIAHLLAHGFFKAGLFLGAGSVMHGMDDEVNMRRYGGLRKFLPITFATFGLGYLAIIGIPPFSGFFTKDGIIDAAWAKGGTDGWILCRGHDRRRRHHRVLHDPGHADDLVRPEALGGGGRARRRRRAPRLHRAAHPAPARVLG